MFFQSDKLQKHDVMQQMKCLPPDVLMHFVESVTGQPSSEYSPFKLIGEIENLPDDQYKDFMSCIDPTVQRHLVLQLTKEKPEYLQLFENKTYVDMLNTLMKQEMVKPMEALEKDTLVRMMFDLPDDLMAIVGSQVDTVKLAEFILDGHHDVLDKAWMV
jgi:hypothetical protein